VETIKSIPEAITQDVKIFLMTYKSNLLESMLMPLIGLFIKVEFLTIVVPTLIMELSLLDMMQNKIGLSETLGDLLGVFLDI
jgi:hypothetical protein